MVIVELSPTEEAELEARDKQVKQKLRLAMQEAERQMQEAEWQKSDAQATLQLVRNATSQEKWWELQGILSPKEIESLCEISPQGLLDDEAEEV